MKSSYFAVDRKLTPEEWEELKSWRAANPDLRWRRGDTRPDGYVFWGYLRDFKAGESWLAPAQFARRRSGVTSRSRVWRTENPEAAKSATRAWRAANVSKERAKTAQWRAANKLRHRAATAAWRSANQDRIKAYSAAWKEANQEYLKKYRDSVRDRVSARNRERLKSDPIYALSRRVRSRTRAAIRNMGIPKRSSTADLIGCSWEDLASHVESRFVDGMTWENRSLWHLDHIVPLASAKTEEDVIRLAHYTNLQPLWALDNLRKADKLQA